MRLSASFFLCDLEYLSFLSDYPSVSCRRKVLAIHEEFMPRIAYTLTQSPTEEDITSTNDEGVR